MFKCDFCDQEFEKYEQLAGHRSGHVRRKEIQRGINIRKKSDLQCKICGKKFEKGSQVSGHSQLHTSFDSIRKDSTRRRRLIFERGHKCEVCQGVEWMGKQIPLELDHMNGDCRNNVKENLRLICPNCHAQTDTYKGKNVGRIKKSERQDVMKKYGSYR